MANNNLHFIYDVLGKKVADLKLEESIFAIENPNQKVVHEVIVAEDANKRQGTHKVKQRGEVSGGGRKPWRQKGTGNARASSIRSPLWRGGGIVFGPTNKKNYTKKVNRKVKRLAYLSAFTWKANEEKGIVVVDKIDFHTPSTKDFARLLTNLEIKDKKILLISKWDDVNLHKSARNINKLKIANPQHIHLRDILNADVILFTQETMDQLVKDFK